MVKFAKIYVIFCTSSSGCVIQYYLLRCVANYDLLEKFNLIGQTSEFARLYGILFYSVLSRGSQVCSVQSSTQCQYYWCACSSVWSQ